jgi:SAM-dependent methyltransferase
MLALLDYLEPPGRYEGLDINPKKIEFAQNNIHPRYPHFNFTVADVYNKFYNPQGKQKGDSYRFPYVDAWFDVVYAASVFTHLLPPDAANYLKESRRVLRKGGLCLFSFFVLDYYRGPGTSTSDIYEFDHPLADFAGVAVYESQVPEHVIAYKIDTIKKIVSEAGLKVLRIVPGFWSKTHKVGVNEQDLILLEAV